MPAFTGTNVVAHLEPFSAWIRAEFCQFVLAASDFSVI
jgi:hypothetical protein